MGEKRGRVLLVEDNHLNQKVFKIMFEDIGCYVDVASNGTEALQKITGDFDLVIMDIGLPDIGGLEVVKRYRAIENSPKRKIILALTGHTLESDKERCTEVGMDGYMTKPLMRQDMINLVDKWLGKAKTPVGAA